MRRSAAAGGRRDGAALDERDGHGHVRGGRRRGFGGIPRRLAKLRDKGGEGAVAHLREVLPDGGQGGRGPFGDGVVVEAGDAQVSRHGMAGFGKGPDGVERHGVAAAHQRRRTRADAEHFRDSRPDCGLPVREAPTGDVEDGGRRDKRGGAGVGDALCARGRRVGREVAEEREPPMARREERLGREAAARAVVGGDRRRRKVGKRLVDDDEGVVGRDKDGEGTVELGVVLRHDDCAGGAGFGQNAELREEGVEVAARVEDGNVEPGVRGVGLHRLGHAHGRGPEQVARKEADRSRGGAFAAHEDAASRAALGKPLVHQHLDRPARGHPRDAVVQRDPDLGADSGAGRKPVLADPATKAVGQSGVGRRGERNAGHGTKTGNGKPETGNRNAGTTCDAESGVAAIILASRVVRKRKIIHV